MTWVKVALFLLGKLGVAFCFTGIYTYSLELFPTSVRGTLIGCGNTAARVGSMLAPLTPLVVIYIRIFLITKYCSFIIIKSSILKNNT